MLNSADLSPFLTFLIIAVLGILEARIDIDGWMGGMIGMGVVRRGFGLDLGWNIISCAYLLCTCYAYKLEMCAMFLFCDSACLLVCMCVCS